MKTRIYGVFAVVAMAGIGLTGCTAGGGSAAAPSQEPSVAPAQSSAPKTSKTAEETVSPFGKQQESVNKLLKDTTILSQVHTKGSLSIAIGELPGKYESVGFLINCSAASAWELQYENGKTFASGSCGPDVPADPGIEVSVDSLQSETVTFAMKDKVEVWATSYAVAKEA